MSILDVCESDSVDLFTDWMMIIVVKLVVKFVAVAMILQIYC